MTLLGTIYLGRPSADRRQTILEANSLDEWASEFRGEILPVLLRHNPLHPVGWITRAHLTTSRLQLFGEWDDTFDPWSARCRDSVRTGRMNGLSPRIETRQSWRKYGTGAWGEGDVHHLAEVSITPDPSFLSAHWRTT